MKKIINLVILLFILTACSGKPKVAMLVTDDSKQKMKYNYVIYTPLRYMAHDPISALKNEKYYVGHNIYTDFLGKVSGERVFHTYIKFISFDKKTKEPIFKNVVESYNKEASFTFSKRYVKIKGIQICNEDNECRNGGLDGKFKLVNEKPN
jgi:hypothetical protein